MSIHVAVTAVIYHALNGSADPSAAAKGLWLKFYLSVKGAGAGQTAALGASGAAGVAPGDMSVWSRKTLAPEEGPWDSMFPGGRPLQASLAIGGRSCLIYRPGKACSRH